MIFLENKDPLITHTCSVRWQFGLWADKFLFPSSPRGRYGETRSFQITGKYLENIKGEPGRGARNLCGRQRWVEKPSGKVQCRQRGAVCQVALKSFLLFSHFSHFLLLSRVRAPPKINWIQLCILVIGVFIGVAGFIATITLCCLYSKWVFETNAREWRVALWMFGTRYKRRIRRSNIKIVEAPVRALIPASLPPGSNIYLNSSP